MEILEDQRPLETAGREVDREITRALPAGTRHALVLTGVRRAGKSVLQHQLMRRHESPFYCNLEDTRLYELSPRDFPAFLSVVEELAPGRAAVFLDEVQEVPEWQRLVRSLLDKGRPVCVTGSNASLLGKELGAKLTGRQVSFEVFPFSYTEYLAYTRQQAGARSLTRYLEEGGFPAYLHERNPSILRELLRDIVLRDIAARHRLREVRHIMNLVLFLLANTGQPFSMQRLTKSLGIPAVAQTSRYLEYVADAYVLFAVPKFSPSFRQRVVTPSKFYAVDNGLRRASAPHATPDLGHRLENAVFLALRRRGESVSYAGERDRWECDFVTATEAVQVCANLTEHNTRREIHGVLQAVAMRGKRRPSIVTMDQRDRLVVEGTTIEVVPAWEWLARGG